MTKVQRKTDNDEKMFKVFRQIIFWVCLFFVSLLFYLILKPMYSVGRNGVVAQSTCIVLITIVLVTGIVLKIKKRLNFEILLLLLFIISILIKLCYMLTTPYNLRQYDTITSNFDGHEGYAFILYNTGALPSTNVYQFYHPCLNAAIQAGFMQFSRNLLEFSNFITGSEVFNLANVFVPTSAIPYTDLYVSHELYMTTQLLSFMYMCITTYFGAKIIYSFKISNVAKLIGICFVIFFPRFVQLSAQENNDAICIMFSTIALYYTVIWFNKNDWKSIVIIAFSVGLAMMSKLSGATICLSIGLMFIIALVLIIKAKENKQIWRMATQFVVFLLICAPIGLWFQFYAMAKFNQPFGYVFSNLNQALSVANVNPFFRFINIFDFYDYFRFFYAAPFENYNLPTYMIKTALFGEFSYWQGEGFAMTAMISNYIFVISSLVLFIIYSIKSKGEHTMAKVFGWSIIIGQLLCMLYFNITMPYGCTMDFRYIVPIVLGFTIMLVLTIDKYHDSKDKKMKWFTYAVSITAIITIASTSLFYLTCI